MSDRRDPFLRVTWTDPVTGRQGYVVIDRLIDGIAGGGTRMRAGVTLEEVERLARTMSIKNGATRLPDGGAKKALDYDPHDPEARPMLLRFVPILLAVTATVLLFMFNRFSSPWQAVIVRCLCIAASLAAIWCIDRTRPSRMSLPLLLVLAAFACVVWLAVIVHTFQILSHPQTGAVASDRLIARKVAAVSVCALVTTVVFKILMGEFKAYRARALVLRRRPSQSRTRSAAEIARAMARTRAGFRAWSKRAAT